MKLIAGNWKMHYGPKEACEFFWDFQRELSTVAETSPSTKSGQCAQSGGQLVFFVPAYCFTPEVRQTAAQAGGAVLGAQNCHWATHGAFTGELSAKVLRSISVDWVLLGHSERRQFFGETDATAGQRLQGAIATGLNVIYCIGETLSERDSGQTQSVLKRQVESFSAALATSTGTAGDSAEALRCIAIAYEPIWAIGTGRTATPAQVQEAHAFLRTIAPTIGGQSIPLLYGGSVNAKNAREILATPNVDGVLVGGASLKPGEFAEIVKSQK